MSDYEIAIKQARAIRSYWIKAGYKGIVVKIRKTLLKDPINDETLPSFQIESNVSNNGYPPKEAIGAF